MEEREGRKDAKEKKNAADTERKYSYRRYTSVVIHSISAAIISVIAWKHRKIHENHGVTFPACDIRKNFVGYFQRLVRVYFIRETILPAAHERFQLN